MARVPSQVLALTLFSSCKQKVHIGAAGAAGQDLPFHHGPLQEEGIVQPGREQLTQAVVKSSAAMP